MKRIAVAVYGSLRVPERTTTVVCAGFHDRMLQIAPQNVVAGVTTVVTERAAVVVIPSRPEEIAVVTGHGSPAFDRHGRDDGQRRFGDMSRVAGCGSEGTRSSWSCAWDGGLEWAQALRWEAAVTSPGSSR